MIKVYLRNTTLTAILAHSIIIVTLYFLMNWYGIFAAIPNQQNLLNWDANWYFSILKNGYVFVPNDACNLAFFPFFPYFWKILGLTPQYMSLLNMLIFFSSVYFLIKKYDLPVLSILILLSIPSLLFMGVPYSEALFFSFSTVILKGYQNNAPNLRRLGFFLVSMIRSVSLIFIPAIVITEFLTGNNQEGIVTRIKKITLDILSCLLGLAVSSTIQFVQTGKWFYFLTVQKYWGREWHIPHFPLTTYSPGRILELDGISFCLGVLALSCLCKKVYSMYFKKDSNTESKWGMGAALIFSCLYITGTTIISTCFTQSYMDNTNITSLNRYLLCTPFAFLFIIYLIRDFEPQKLTLIFYGLIPLLGLYITGVYRHYVALFYVAFFINIAFMRFHPYFQYVALPFYVISLYAQIHFYHDFLLSKWVG